MNSNSQSVTIVPDEQGNAIRVSKTNAEYAHIRLVQQKVFFNTQGWVDNKSRSTLVHGKLEDLKAMGFEPGQELSGNIVIREQTEPFNSSNPDRDLKVAGDTGIVCVGVNPETGEEKMFFPLDNVREKVYYMGINEKSLLDGAYFSKLKKSMREKAEQEDVKISFQINETKYEENYVYFVALTDEPQDEEKIKKFLTSGLE